MKHATIKNSIRSTNVHRARILVLYNSWFLYAETTREHVEMFAAFSQHDVTCADVSILDFDINLNDFEAIVFHYSVVIPAWHTDFSEKRRNDIINTRAIKLLFIQDEFRWVTSVTNAITELGISVVFSVQPGDTIKAAYQTHPYWKTPMLQDVRFEQTLTGFVDQKLTTREVPDYEKRPLDVTYRARKLPFWVGRAGLEKFNIAARFLTDSKAFKLKCDISTDESARIYGDAWFDFTASSKATLGTEGSSGLIDFDGTLIPAVDAYCAQNPEATFEEVEAACFPGKDGLIKFRAISPRCFEAAALRTLMIMYKGEYSGVLEAGRHYVELKRDHSNIKEVVKILRDAKEAKSYIARAYDEIACSNKWTSRAFMQKFDKVVSEELAKHRATGAIPAREPFPGYASLVSIKSDKEPTSQGLGEQLAKLAQLHGDVLTLLPAQTQALTHVLQSISGQVSTHNEAALGATALAAPIAVDALALNYEMPLVEAVTEVPDVAPFVETPLEVDYTQEQPVADVVIENEVPQQTSLIVPESSNDMVEKAPKIPWTAGRIVRGVARRIIPASVSQSFQARGIHWAGQMDRLKRSYQIFLVAPDKRRTPV